MTHGTDSKPWKRTLVAILVGTLGLSCASSVPDQPDLVQQEPTSQVGEQLEEPVPVDEQAVMLEFGELLAEVALAGGDALERTLAVSAADGFDPSCAPPWAHELLENVADGPTTVEVTPSGVRVAGAKVPVEVRVGRAVHLDGECEGRLLQPDRSRDAGSSNPPPDPQEATQSAQPGPEPEPQLDPEPDQEAHAPSDGRTDPDEHDGAATAPAPTSLELRVIDSGFSWAPWGSDGAPAVSAGAVIRNPTPHAGGRFRVVYLVRDAAGNARGTAREWVRYAPEDTTFHVGYRLYLDPGPPPASLEITVESPPLASLPAPNMGAFSSSGLST